MARGNTSTAHVVISMEGQQAINLMQAMQRQAKKTRQELEMMERTGYAHTDEYKEKKKDLESMERAIRANRTAYIDLDKTVKNLNKTTLGQLQKALKECRKQMQNLTADDPKMKKLIAQYRAIDNQIGQITGQWRRQDGAIGSVVKRLTAYVSVYGAFNVIKNSISSVVKKNLEFSDSLADIQKTTGLSAQNVAELSNNINKIDTRTSVQELHNLAYEAGRLGIGGGGADAVLGFVRAANQLKVALGEDLGEDAIVQLAKMGDVMGTSKKMGVEQALLATGSAINELSQSSTASGKFIADYAQRLSGIATQAHLTTAELLGFAAASDATGQELEVSATAMNKFIVQMQTHYKTVAQAAGVNADTLHEMLTMGETADAVVMVLEALADKGGLSMLAPLMKDLGSDGARLTASLSTMASNVELVKEQLDIARKSFEEGISVTNEYNVKNENAAAIMERMRNSWEKMFVNSANTGVVKDLAQQLFDLSNSLQNNEKFLAILNGSMNLLISTVKLLIDMAPMLAAFFATKGIIAFGTAIVRGVVPALASLKVAFTSGAAASTRFTAAFGALNAVMKSNAIILAISALITLGTRLVKVTKEVDTATRDMEALNKNFAQFEHNSSASAVQVDYLFNKLRSLNPKSKEYKDLLKDINTQYGKYLPYQLTEKTNLEQLATAQEILNGKLRQSIALKAKNQAIDEIGVETMKKLADNRSNIQEVFNKYGLQGVGKNLTSVIQRQAQEDYNNRIAGGTAVDMWTKGWGEHYQKLMYPAMEALKKQGGTTEDQGVIVNALKDFYRTYYRQQNQILAINQRYDPIIKGFTEPEANDAPYTIVETDEEKKKRELNEKRTWARDQYKAVMSAIEVYYRQQEQVINQMTEEGKITNTERELKLEQLKNQQLGTQVAARSYLHGDKGASSKWSAELQRMGLENLSTSDASDAAMENLWSKDLKKTGDFLRKFGEATDDAIWKNLETDKVKMQESAIEQQEEVRQILLKGDYTGLVTEQYLEAFQKLGFFSSQITDEFGNVIKQFTRGELTTELEKMNTIYSDLFNIDIATSKGKEDFQKLLTSIGHTAEYTEEELEKLYYTTVEYGDAMLEAERKARQAGQRVADERWRQSGGLAKEQGLESRGAAIKDTTSLYSRVGLASENVANDLEIQMYEEKMEAALAYRDLVIKSGGDIEKANEKVQESIADLSNALVEKTMMQLETLKSFMDPLEDLGEELGEAFAIDDATERTEAFREAMWGAAEDVADATKEMITNWVKQKIQHAINKKAIQAQEAASQATTTAIVQTGEQAKAMAVQQSETQISTTKATKAAENITTEATETSTSGALNIAKGSAKTIGELGWWGIPLVAVISALIGGLISWAMGKVKGSAKAATDAAPATTGKVVSGMLAYDSGNVQSVLGSDGNTYAARVGGIGSGSGIVTAPTLTNVGGQAALVGEQGPEIVIGRATTRAMMQDNPRLLHSLVQFDRLHSGRGFRTYDNGNIGEFGMGTDGGNNMADTIARMNQTIDNLSRQLSRGIHANVVRKELVEEAVNGMYEEKQRGNNKNLKRLLG